MNLLRIQSVNCKSEPDMLTIPPVPEEITYDNFPKICRSCIVNKGEIDLFEAYMQDLPLSNIIFVCTNEQISKTDGLSRVICNTCMERLVNSYSFIKKFKESQVNIRNIYEILGKRSRTCTNINKSISNDGISLEEEEIQCNEKNILKISKEQGNSIFGYNQSITENKDSSDENQSSRIGKFVTSISSQLPEEKFLQTISEPEKCTIDDLSSDFPEPNSDNIILDDTKGKKGRKPNKRIEVDPMLRSGLDLQCFQCLTIFSSKAEMVRHHKTTSHTMAPNYKCGICSKAISKRKAYWDHLAMHRHLKKKAVCEVCGAVVVSLHLKRHMLVHQEKTHVCQYCGKGYVQKNTLTDHVKRKHEGDERDMNTLCFICGKLCNDLKGLTTHLNTHTDDKLKGLSYRCEDCGKYFLNAQSLGTHAYMAHRITERIPKQHKRSRMIRQKPKRLPKEKKENKEKKREPTPRDEMSEGKKKNVKREPRECPVCHKMICHLGYTRHLTTHTGVKPHQCKHCPKSFRLFTSLKSHMYVHLDLKPFKCDVCGQQFRHCTTLKVHKRVHTGEKPYGCTVCSKGFRSASGLKRHQNQRQHHRKIEMGETPNQVEPPKAND